MDFGTKLIQQVSFTPAPGLTNPVGQMNTILSRLDELEKNFNRLSAEDLMAVEKNILRYDYNPKKDKVTAVPNETLLNYKMNLADNDEIAKILQEVSLLSVERDRLLDSKEGYAYLRNYEENKRAAAAIGKSRSDFFDSMTESVTGYSKPKFQKSQELYENEARASLYLQLRGIQIGQKDADIRKAYKEEEDARIKEQTSQLPID
jgi:glycogen debranching enzyme